jgi:AcrR family transcriptional regulator
MSVSGMANRRADALANREAILAAARTVLADNPRASLTAIAAAAGVAPRTLYGHFATREDLTEALTAAVGAELTAHVTALEDGPDSLENLARFVQATSAFNARNFRLRELASEPGARDNITAATRLMRQRLHALIEQGVDAGELGADIPPTAAVRLIAAMQWAVYDALAADELTAEEAPRVAVTAVLGALGASRRRITTMIRRIF